MEIYVVDSPSYSALYNKSYVETSTATYKISFSDGADGPRFASWAQSLSASGGSMANGIHRASADWTMSDPSPDLLHYSDFGGNRYSPRVMDFPLDFPTLPNSFAVSGKISASTTDFTGGATPLVLSTSVRTIVCGHVPSIYQANIVYTNATDPTYGPYPTTIRGVETKSELGVVSATMTMTAYNRIGPSGLMPRSFTASVNSTTAAPFVQINYGKVTRPDGTTKWEPISISTDTSANAWTQSAQLEPIPPEKKAVFSAGFIRVQAYDPASILLPIPMAPYVVPAGF